MAEPFTPKNLDSIIFTIEENEESKKISKLLNSIDAEPNNLQLVDELLSLYIKITKVKSDVSYMGYAKAFLTPYLKKYPRSYMLKMHLVDILQYTHKFDEALLLLKSIKSVREAKPYLVTATIYQAREDYNASLLACKKLIFRASHLLSATCISSMQSHLGKLEPSYKLLQDVYAKAKNEESSEKSWALTSLADMAYRLDKKEEAIAYLQEVLLLDTKDYFALKKLSEIYLEQENYTEVKVLLEEYEYVDSLLLRLTVAREKLGENVSLAKENLKAFVKALKLRDEKPHKEDLPYFNMLGIK